VLTTLRTQSIVILTEVRFNHRNKNKYLQAKA